MVYNFKKLKTYIKIEKTSSCIQGSNDELIGVPKTEKEEEIFEVQMVLPKLRRKMSFFERRS